MRSFFQSVNRFVYFKAAAYFAFWAKFVLRRWKPRVIVVTGSSGKTTMLNMLEAQMGSQCLVSHGANSAFGIPLHLLGMKGIQESRSEWIGLFFKAPIKAFTSKYPGKIYYIAEADADRPGEGKFLAKLLQPEITVWVSSARTHGMNFDFLVKKGKFQTVEKAIAHEYGYFARATTGVVCADGDNPDVVEQVKGIEAKVELVTQKESVKDYRMSEGQSIVTLKEGLTYVFKEPQPPVIGYLVSFVHFVIKSLRIEPDYSFERLNYPPGRSRVFKGINNTTLIDSTYNANLSSMTAMLSMYEKYPGKRKYLVLGDMLEQGSGEAAEHHRLAELVVGLKFSPEQIILLGPRVKRFTAPILKEKLPNIPVSTFVNPRDVLNLLKIELTEGDVVLFKGARFLEGVIEHLLEDQTQKDQLVRQDAIWSRRRAEWGL